MMWIPLEQHLHFYIHFCFVPVGAPGDVGESLLEACAGNLEMAIGMHMDSDGDNALPPVASTAAAAPAVTEALPMVERQRKNS